MSGRKRLSTAEARQVHFLKMRAFFKQDGKCYWCGKIMIRGQQGDDCLTGDHVMPLWQGGRTKPGNIVAACKACNDTRTPIPRLGPGLVASAGDVSPRSPFELLIKHNKGEAT